MAKTGKLTWTQKQREVAALAGQGKKLIDIVNSGYTRHMTSKVLNAIKAGDVPDAGSPQTKPAVTPGAGATLYRQSTTKVRDRVVDATELGVLLAIPEDWRISQHDTYLLLDTYYLTKEEINYEGSMGEFLGLMCRVFRHGMRYARLPEAGPVAVIESIKEEPDGREEDGEGAGSSGQGIPDDGAEGEWREVPVA